MLVCPKHRHFIEGKRIAYDTETTGLRVHRGDRAFTFSFANEDGDTAAFEFDVDPLTRRVTPRQDVLDKVGRLLADPEIVKIGFNTKFDNRMAHEGWGLPVIGRIEDVMWKAHGCNSAEMVHGLKPLSDKYAGLDNSDETELGAAVKACRLKARTLKWMIAKDEGGSGKKKESAYKSDYWLPAAIVRYAPKEVSKALLERWPNLATLNHTYAIKDAVRTITLDLFYSEIMDDEGLWPAYERELRMLPVTYATERRGVRIVPERCREVSAECDRNLTVLRARLSEIFGDFEIEVSDNKVRQYLFSPRKAGPLSGGGGLGLPIVRLTEKKLPSVDKVVKDRYLHIPVVRDLKDFDKYHKAKSHYVEKYLRHGVPTEIGETIIHADIKQCEATTGRMAVGDPPLQQTPKRAIKGDIMKRVRYPFAPRKGYVWIHYDFKSIEPRILAEEAGEEDMIRIFGEGGDPYVVLVDRVATATRRTPDDLDALFEARGGARQVCKNNFLGWTYGEGVRKLAAQMGCSEDDAVTIIQALQNGFPGVGPFMKEMQARAKRDGHIRNRYGRKAVIPRPARVLDDDGTWKWVEFWYKATNYLIQGTAADLLKEAAIRLGGEDHYYDRAGTRHECTAGFLKGNDCHIVLPIHDELIIEVPTKRAIRDEKFVRQIGDVMADNCGMFKRVATLVDGHISWTAWSDPEALETLWGVPKETELEVCT